MRARTHGRRRHARLSLLATPDLPGAPHTSGGAHPSACAGEPAGSDALRRACTFLLSTQNANGGWGEDFTSCYDKAYAAEGMARYGRGGSGVVNTAWALLALMAAGSTDGAAVSRGIDYLLAEQLPNGDWAQEGIAGVFNRACGISYTQYRNIFPMWALARFARHYGPKMGLTTAVTSAPKRKSTPKRPATPKRSAASPKRRAASPKPKRGAK